VPVHQRSHIDERPYICQICDMAFHQQGNLDHHMNRHTGHYRFECDICGRKFVQKIQLQSHQRTTCVDEINSVLFKENLPKIPSFGVDRKPKTETVNRKAPKSNVRNSTMLMIKAPKSEKKKPKRKTAAQVETLEDFFQRVTANPSRTEMEAIAAETALKSNTVKQWFMNRRVKQRKFP